MARTLNPDARRIRTIIISAPFLVASSLLLYKRLYLGEPQRRLPPSPPPASSQPSHHPGDLEGVPAEVAARIRQAEQDARR